MRHFFGPVAITTVALGIVGASALEANGQTLFGAAKEPGSDESRLYSIDETTGSATSVGLIGFDRVSGLDFDPATGILYGVGYRPGTFPTEHVLFTVEPTTGAGTEVGLTGVGLPVTDISFRNGDSVLYGFFEGFDASGTLNITTGAHTIHGASGPGCCGNGLAFSASDVLFHANEVAVYTLDQTTGAVNSTTAIDYSTVPPPVSVRPNRINGLDHHPATDVLYVSVNRGTGSTPASELATLDTTTGVLTDIGPTADAMDALAWQPKDEKVPAVSEWGMASVALLLLAGLTIKFGALRFRKAA